MTTITITLKDNQNSKDFVSDVERTLGHRIRTILIEAPKPFSEEYPEGWPYIPDYPQEEDDG